MLTRILLALDDPRAARRLRALLAQPDVVLEQVGPRRDLWRALAHRSGDVVLVSRAVVPEPAPDSVAALRSLPDAPEVVVLSGREDAQDRARLLAGGCHAVLPESLEPEVLREVLGAALARRRERRPGADARASHPRLSDFITRSAAMRAFMDVVHRVVHSGTSLLILGETGVGKEHLARAIHAEGPRADAPFVAINCGALAESLLESELFGHEEGAFTGATRSRRGCFELAHRGTLFLDEICDLPAHLQVNLLQALQRREITRLGGEAPIPVDVRVMAATNRDVVEEVASRRLRSDLYYRLSVVSLSIPPLRERREDIRTLVDGYLEHFRSNIRRDVLGVEPAALEALEHYGWPGNVRELINILERAMLLSSGPEIGLQDLPESVRAAAPGAAPALPAVPVAADAEGPGWCDRPLREVRREAADAVERRYLSALLARTGGSIQETARRAGMRERSLFDRMRKLGLRKEDFRTPARPQGPSL